MESEGWGRLLQRVQQEAEGNSLINDSGRLHFLAGGRLGHDFPQPCPGLFPSRIFPAWGFRAGRNSV
jgi:hypothetical protein